jgi:hypothetical protein
MNELRGPLDIATDRVEAPDLAVQALAGARRRRTARRGVALAALAAVSVVVAAVVVDRAADQGVTPPVVELPTPTPKLIEQIAQPTFDPLQVEGLPDAPENLAPVLPEAVRLPAVSSWLTDEPIEAAVLAFRGEDAVALLGADGRWASVPYPVSADPFPWVALNADGTRLGISTPDGITVWTLATAERTFIPVPEDYHINEGDAAVFFWVGSLVLLDNRQPGLGGWLLDVPPSKPVSEPYPRGGVIGHASVDETGVVVESVFNIDTSGEKNKGVAELIDWAGGHARSVGFSEQVGELSSLQARADLVAGTRYGAVVLLNRDDLSEVAVLPVDDVEGNFQDGKAPVVALFHDGTILQQVPLLGSNHTGDWCLIAWRPTSGELSRVSCGATGGVPASYAVGLLD